MATTSGETAKQWLEKRKLQALKRHQGQHEVPRSIPNNTNIEPQVLTLFLQTAQDQMKSLSLYRKEMFLRGGQMLLPWKGNKLFVSFFFCLFVCL